MPVRRSRESQIISLLERLKARTQDNETLRLINDLEGTCQELISDLYTYAAWDELVKTVSSAITTLSMTVSDNTSKIQAFTPIVSKLKDELAHIEEARIRHTREGDTARAVALKATEDAKKATEDAKTAAENAKAAEADALQTKWQSLRAIVEHPNLGRLLMIIMFVMNLLFGAQMMLAKADNDKEVHTDDNESSTQP